MRGGQESQDKPAPATNQQPEFKLTTTNVPPGAPIHYVDAPDLWKVGEEQAVKQELAELFRKAIMDSNQIGKVNINEPPRAVPVECSLETGLRCIVIQERMGNILGGEERRRLVDRVNVLLRSHKPFGVALQVKP